MNAKLTLRLDEALIDRAKRYSAQSGKSVSQLVADYLALIDPRPGQTEVTPRVRALRGVLAGTNADKADHRRHLQEKHQ